MTSLSRLLSTTVVRIHNRMRYKVCSSVEEENYFCHRLACCIGLSNIVPDTDKQEDGLVAGKAEKSLMEDGVYTEYV